MTYCDKSILKPECGNKKCKPCYHTTRTFCPTCGDVTNGHPAMDKIAADTLNNGFSASETMKYKYPKYPFCSTCKDSRKDENGLECWECGPYIKPESV